MQVLDENMLADMAAKRSQIYEFLVMFYLRRPTRVFLEKLSRAASSLSGIDPAIADALNMIVDDLERANSLDELELELGVEFTRLFRGIKEGYSPPPPYESVYRGEGRLYGEYTLQVIREYQRNGYMPGEEHLDPPDYISVELDYMSYLAGREASAWRSRDKDKALNIIDSEIHFLRDHMLAWIPRFCDVVLKESKTKFYKGVAILTRRWLEIDDEYLGNVLAYLRNSAN